MSLGGPNGEVKLKVAGTLPALEGGGPIAVMDIAAVQLYFGRIGVISRIDLRLTPDAPREAALREITALLPPGVSLTRPDEAAMRTAGLTQAYRVNLTALALMALFTGGFLVFSTLALQAARRRQEFALLRALGLTAGGVRAFLAIEGGLLGLAGALAGTVLGLRRAAPCWRSSATTSGPDSSRARAIPSRRTRARSRSSACWGSSPPLRPRSP